VEANTTDVVLIPATKSGESPDAVASRLPSLMEHVLALTDRDIGLLSSQAEHAGLEYSGGQTNERGRITKEARLHLLIRDEIRRHDAAFAPTQVNIPFCGPTVAGESAILGAVYDDPQLPIHATDFYQRYIDEGNGELQRLRQSGLSLNNVTVEQGDSRNIKSYKSPTNFVLARNIPHTVENSPWDPIALEFAFSTIHRVLDTKGYFVVSAFNENRNAETLQALAKAGFTVVSMLSDFPASERDAMGAPDTELGDAVIFICQKTQE